VVIGACVDEAEVTASGAAIVLGEAEPEEYATLVARYRIGRLAGLDRAGGFGELDRLAAAVGAPKAYFDLSQGELAVASGDLALDMRLDDAAAALALTQWLG
jgi:hypothetical protein